MLNSKTLAVVAMALAATFMAAEPAAAQSRVPPGSAPRGEQVLPGRVGGDRTDRAAQAERQEQGRRRQRVVPGTPAPLTPEQISANAQAQLTATNTTCQMSEATHPGMVGEGPVYEVACSGGPGYILIASTPPQAFNCIELAGTAAIARSRDPNADVGQQCLIPANQNTLAVVGGWAREAGVTCTIDEALAIGKSDADNMVYEVGCAGADGYWLEKVAAGWDLKDCMFVLSTGGSCRFTTPQEQADGVEAKLAGTDAAGCDVTQARLMGSNANGKFYEVKCAAEGEGFIARVNNEGATQQVYPCATAQRIGGGCTLTPAPAAAPATGGRP